MGDDLGDEWWQHEGNSDVSEKEEEEKDEEQKQSTEIPQKKSTKKRKSVTENPVNVQKKKKLKKAEPKESVVAPEKNEESTKKPRKKRKKKKKTITDVLATSEPKPGSPSDLQNLVVNYFSDKRSVIEQEELALPDSSFLSSNDLSHTLSSYLKEICPKWAKVQKQHTEKSSVVLLIVCSSALRTIELIKQLTTFKGDARALKLFAKHIKVEEQVKLLQKAVTHIGVGTPARICSLIDREGLNLQTLRYLVLDWNWRDQKLRRMVDVAEVKVDLLKLLETGGLVSRCRGGQVKIGLF